ncbi:hypothetical protein PRECH8_15640 [Insulibacter thermoxylanivorax]|uniref:AAA domain-containing protein n=1 Tax=Insulibacter thermoxylanivorax TaxID=2749268 RepID=A0A916QFT7_9BACL|nr:hypothetical protein [Insulibacter thermoxylanivorax]GFR38268.1 hypothetical protein PRECH8_15640 [Insulibacter thermoxylanivorax]
MLELAFLTRDQEYAERFIRYIQNSPWQERVLIHRFSDVQSLLVFSEEFDSEAVFLLDEEAAELQEKNDDSKLGKLLLTDMPATDKRETDQSPSDKSEHKRARWFVLTERQDPASPNRLFRYQPVSELLQHLYRVGRPNHSAHLEGVTSRSGEKPQPRPAAVIGIVSPYGGSGVTTVSCQLAGMLALRQEKVLYMHLDLYPEPSLTANVEYDFSRFLYALTTRPEELEGSWHRYCGRHAASGVYCFRAPAVRRDLRDVETAHLNEACRLFAGLGFETIVLDLDAYFLDDLLEGRLAHDECWMILPWSKRDLQGFPALKVFAERSSVRCLLNHVHAPAGIGVDPLPEYAEAVLPHVPSLREQEDPAKMPDARYSSVLQRLIRESAVLRGGAEIHG